MLTLQEIINTIEKPNLPDRSAGTNPSFTMMMPKTLLIFKTKIILKLLDLMSNPSSFKMGTGMWQVTYMLN
jgi:hypothetical protein